MSDERGSTLIISLATEIERCLDAGLHHVALLTALTVPDICGAMDERDGESKHEKTYAPWFQKETARLASAYKRKLAALNELKQSMLHQAFNGQL